jgi:hypothetical protein
MVSLPLKENNQMALSTCVKCGGTFFEVVQVEPQGSAFKMLFVQCSACGGVVGVQEFFNVGDLVHTLAERLGVKL